MWFHTGLFERVLYSLQEKGMSMRGLSYAICSTVFRVSSRFEGDHRAVQRQHARPPREPPLGFGLNQFEIISHNNLSQDNLHHRRAIETTRTTEISTLADTFSDVGRLTKPYARCPTYGMCYSDPSTSKALVAGPQAILCHFQALPYRSTPEDPRSGSLGSPVPWGNASHLASSP